MLEPIGIREPRLVYDKKSHNSKLDSGETAIVAHKTTTPTYLGSQPGLVSAGGPNLTVG